MKNDYDANQYLIETAKLRTVDKPDPLELTQRMPVADRRYRQREARLMHGGLDMYYRPLSSPERHKPWPDFREHLNGTLRREYRLSPHELAQQNGFPND